MNKPKSSRSDRMLKRDKLRYDEDEMAKRKLRYASAQKKRKMTLFQKDLTAALTDVQENGGKMTAVAAEYKNISYAQLNRLLIIITTTFFVHIVLFTYCIIS